MYLLTCNYSMIVIHTHIHIYACIAFEQIVHLKRSCYYYGNNTVTYSSIIQSSLPFFNEHGASNQQRRSLLRPLTFLYYGLLSRYIQRCIRIKEKTRDVFLSPNLAIRFILSKYKVSSHLPIIFYERIIYHNDGFKSHIIVSCLGFILLLCWGFLWGHRQNYLVQISQLCKIRDHWNYEILI